MILTREVGGTFEPVEAPEVLITTGWPIAFCDVLYPDDAQWLIDHGYYKAVAASANDGTWGCRWSRASTDTDRHYVRLTALAVASMWHDEDLGVTSPGTAAAISEQQRYATARGLDAIDASPGAESGRD